jgi:hypothetical protein
MNRAVIVAAIALTTAALALATGAPAEARTPSWLHVTTATHATAYNGGKATVRPGARASGHRVITSRKITVYRHGRKYRSGKAVRLAPGKYKTVTSGYYKAYTYVRQARTRTVTHYGDLVTATCTVSSVDDVGLGDGSTHSFASCRNSYYPGQSQPDEEWEHYQVGDTYTTDVFFDDQPVQQTYYVNVRKYGAAHHFTSKRRNLTVRNGGFRRLFRGSGTTETRSFRPPSGSWRINYSFNCSDWGADGNMIIWVYRSNGDPIQLAANDLDYRGSGHTHVHKSGRFYLDIDSECDWVVTVRD